MIDQLLQPSVLLPWLLSMIFGIFVGATPGLTATMAVALIIPLSFYLDPSAGIAMVIGVSFTAIFAGDIPATYLRIPGTPASAAATLDSHELAKRGQGDLALLVDLICSVLGGLVGVLFLILCSAPLAVLALSFSDFEYFWLGILGLSMSALVCEGYAIRGVLSAMIGILIGTIGMDVVVGQPRYPFLKTIGNADLMSGLGFIPAMIGLFGIAEVLRSAAGQTDWSKSKSPTMARQSLGALWIEALRTTALHKWLMLRSSLLGTLIGALPGAGADIAAWGAYGLARKTSRRSQDFGHGSMEGIVGPTSANNAAVAGAWIPALVFGIPGDAITAIVLGAMLMYNITPGPKLFAPENASQLNTIFAIALITQFLLLPIGFLGIKAFSGLSRLPQRYILAGVVVFSVVGAYALNNSLFDVYVMFAFGLLGYFMESRRIPVAPLILGMILGELVERKLRSGLIATQGDFTPLFTRPICLLLITILLLAIFSGPCMRLLSRVRKPARDSDGLPTP
ncbi:MAG: tripartite tricarboxylate transporter permease [Pirellulaceae bacterium]|nr:tripartite tricarboxylate transporter permease [Pirellulaceae bacterium]